MKNKTFKQNKKNNDVFVRRYKPHSNLLLGTCKTVSHHQTTGIMCQATL